MKRQTVMASFLVVLVLSFPALAGAEEREKLTKQTLSEPTLLNGVWCERVAFVDARGQMRYCRLARDTEMSGNVLPAGSWVHFPPNRGSVDWVFLPKDTSLDGHVCRGRANDYMTAFHPGGTVRVCWLAQDEVIDSVPCRRAGFWSDVTGGSVGAHFYPNKKLSQCESSRAFTLQGRSFRRGDTVRLDQNGRLTD